LNSISHVGTIAHYTIEQVKETPVHIPSIDEQIKIGSYLVKLDNLITLHQHKYENLVNIKKALLEKMFTNKKNDIPEIRFKGFTDAWEQHNLGKLVEFSKGKGLSWKDIQENGKHECILYGHLYTDYGMVINKINHRTNTFTRDLVLSKYGDVLIPSSDTTPTGLARASSIEKEGVILGGDINILRPKNYVNGSFLSYNINFNRSQLLSLIKGSTVRHIYNSDLESVDISIPNTTEEQVKIASLLKKFDDLITLHQRQLEKINNIKKACLKKMFV
jgi:restriction endonuclease S subunit